MMVLILLMYYMTSSVELTPGIMGNGMGGMTVLMDEGIPVFHNPAINHQKIFNFILGKWFYGINNFTFGVTYQKNALALYYLNYGEIQGYDEYGTATGRFAPYDLNIGYARRVGAWGFCLKNFQTRIDTVFYTGIVGGIGLYSNFSRCAFGLKVDNIGAELIHYAAVPLIFGIGIRYALFEEADIFFEIKGKDLEIGAGFLYQYGYLKLLSGIRYIKPQDYLKQDFLKDCLLTGGVMVSVNEYEIGYVLIMSSFSSAHQLGIKLTPE
ncbi:MAG: hypothetical protein ABIL40_07565 [candidate division WOR-3 bacterium]